MPQQEFAPLVTGDGSTDAREVLEALLDGLGELRLELRDVRDDLRNPLFVELDRLGDVVEDAEVVDDQAMGLFLAVRSVGSVIRVQSDET